MIHRKPSRASWWNWNTSRQTASHSLISLIQIDNILAEYITVMVVNGKSRTEIDAELVECTVLGSRIIWCSDWGSLHARLFRLAGWPFAGYGTIRYITRTQGIHPVDTVGSTGS
jgi:hypothetical protein